jgi:hypothetical protein
MQKTIPLAPVSETGITELVGKNEQVDQNDFGGSVSFTVGIGGLSVSGEFLSLILTTLETGSGAVQTPAGHLLLFDADPNPTVGDTALTAAEWKTAIGSVEITAADWISDANGSHVFKDIAIPFHELVTIYAVWFHTGATSFNDAAGDDEELHCNLWYRRDS